MFLVYLLCLSCLRFEIFLLVVCKFPMFLNCLGRFCLLSQKMLFCKFCFVLHKVSCFYSIKKLWRTPNESSRNRRKTKRRVACSVLEMDRQTPTPMYSRFTTKCIVGQGLNVCINGHFCACARMHKDTSRTCCVNVLMHTYIYFCTQTSTRAWLLFARMPTMREGVVSSHVLVRCNAVRCLVVT